MIRRRFFFDKLRAPTQILLSCTQNIICELYETNADLLFRTTGGRRTS